MQRVFCILMMKGACTENTLFHFQGVGHGYSSISSSAGSVDSRRNHSPAERRCTVAAVPPSSWVSFVNIRMIEASLPEGM